MGTEIKEGLIAELKRRVKDKILEPTNAELLEKLISNAENDNEAMMIAELGTTYKKTGFHFDPRLEKMSDDIRYFKKNQKLSFHTDDNKPTHKLIIGDNYEALQNLLVQYKGNVDVIYIDPPYGKDNMGNFAKTNYQNAITRDNLLSMLYPRLQLAKQLLAPSGVIFCSIDDRNQAYVKCLFDEVFGENKFVCNYIWQKKTGASDAKGIAVITEYILTYCNNADSAVWNDIFTQNTMSFDSKRYRYSDEYEKERGAYYPDNLDRGGLNYSDSMNFGIKCPDGTITFPNGRRKFEKDGWIWKWGKEKVAWGIKNGFIEFRKSKDKASGWAVCYKNYIYVDNENSPVDRAAPYKNLITDILNGEGTDDLKSIFPNMSIFKNPKPQSLISYLIASIANKNSIVVDFFAGSGTTGHSILDLNVSDGGNREFIVCQLNENLDESLKSATGTSKTIIENQIALCEKYKRPHELSEITAERLRRIMTGKCYDGSKDFPWLKDNKPYGGNLDVYEIAKVLDSETSKGRTPFDVIDETLYGKEKFKSLKEKVQWVCEKFPNARKHL